MYLGSWDIDDFLTFTVTTHDPSTGVLTDADAVPTYRIYEDETTTPILTGSMAKLDDANTTGYYSERVQLTAANGFESGKSYSIYISATVNSSQGAIVKGFQIGAAVKADVVALSGDATAANNMEADYDGTGYNKANSTLGTVSALTGHTPQTGDNYARIGAPVAASISADIADVEGKVDDLEGRITAARAGYLDNLNIGETVAGISDIPTAANNADAVWDEGKAAHQGVGTFGEEMQAHALSAEIAALNDLSSAEVAAQLATYDAPTKAELDAAETAIIAAVPTAANNADAVWDEAIADHQGVGSVGEALATGGIDPSVVAAAVWDRLLWQHTTPDSAGKHLQDISSNLPPSAATVAAEVWDRQESLHSDFGSFGVRVKNLISAPSSNVEDYKADLTGVATDAHLDTIQALLDTSGVELSQAAILATAQKVLQLGISGLEDTSEAYSLVRLILFVMKTEILQISETIGTKRTYKADGSLFYDESVDLDKNAIPVTGVGT